jgi:hypothetical protein
VRLPAAMMYSDSVIAIALLCTRCLITPATGDRVISSGRRIAISGMARGLTIADPAGYPHFTDVSDANVNQCAPQFEIASRRPSRRSNHSEDIVCPQIAYPSMSQAPTLN